MKEPFLDLSLPIVDSQAGRTSTYNFNKRPRDDDKEEAKTFNGVFQLLKRNGDKDIALPMDSERSHNGRCNIVNCLNEYTDLEVMDSDNMFICTECNKRESMVGVLYTTWCTKRRIFCKCVILYHVGELMSQSVKSTFWNSYTEETYRTVNNPAKKVYQFYLSKQSAIYVDLVCDSFNS